MLFVEVMDNASPAEHSRCAGLTATHARMRDTTRAKWNRINFGTERRLYVVGLENHTNTTQQITGL